MWRYFKTLFLNCVIIFISTILLISSSNVYAAKNSATVVDMTEKERVFLSFSVLAQALNNPNFINIENILPVFPDDYHEQAKNLVSYLNSAKANLVGRFPFEVKTEIWFNPMEITESELDYLAKAEIFLRINNLVSIDSISLNFKKNGFMPTILNADTFMQKINRFVDISIDKNIDLIKEDTAKNFDNQCSIPNERSTEVFVPTNLYSNSYATVPRFTVNKSMELWGHWACSRPYDILALRLIDYPFYEHDMTICMDRNWDRIIANDAPSNEWTVFGSYGAGESNFNQPSGIDVILPDGYIVADNFNNRAMIFKGSVNQGVLSFVFEDEITNNYDNVTDIASAYIKKNDSTYYREFAVLDGGGSKVDIFKFSDYHSFIHELTLLSHGSGYEQVDYPSSVCYARSPLDNYNYPTIYITDLGNNRIIAMRTDDPEYSFRESNYEFPPDAILTSIDTDNYGYIYVTDNANSTIYMFHSSLGDPIAIFGSEGINDGQLYRPNKFKIAKGWAFNPDAWCWQPMILGDAFVTETFAAETGIRRFTLGNAMTPLGISYYAGAANGGYDVLRFEWLQSGVTQSWRYVYFNGNLIDSQHDTLNIPAVHYQTYWSETVLEEGYYKFVTTAESRYIPGSYATVLDSIYIGPDFDGDGIPNLFDNCPSVANPYQGDDDSDGVGNLCDNCRAIANQNQLDTDEDGVGDECDNCSVVYNPEQTDTDLDGIGDSCDVCTDTDNDGYGNPEFYANTCDGDNCPNDYNPAQSDDDLDGVGDACDNCLGLANSDQIDTDGDGIGDSCEYCTDTDNDGFGNPGFPADTCQIDNCPYAYNPLQEDVDFDGIGDSCDNCPEIANSDQADIDGDTIGDLCDNCDYQYNTNQTDIDFDGIGDSCDNCPDNANSDQTDVDDDTIGDICDNCQNTANRFQEDFDNDGVGDACDPDCPLLFGERHEYTGFRCGPVCYADFNLDGYQDIATLNNNYIYVMLNGGDGTFQSIVGYNYNVVSYGPAIIAADFNGDNYPDLAAASNGVLIMLNNGLGGFPDTITYQTEGIIGEATPLCSRDFDNDGDNDIVALCFIPGRINTFINNGDGTFQPAYWLLPLAHSPTALTSGDFNNDGYYDLAIGYIASSTYGIEILRNNGTGLFTGTGPDFSGDLPEGLAVADFNHDGYDDIASINANSICMYLNDGECHFYNPIYFFTTLFYNSTSIAAADLDKDNDIDLIITGNKSWTSSENAAVIMLNQGDSVFTDSSLVEAPLYGMDSAGFVSLVDLNSDCIKDIVIGSNGITTLFNLTTGECICGDVNADGTINVLDITYLLTYFYEQGPPPYPPRVADANSDYVINIFDITVIISYLYLEGPAPDCPD